MDGVSASEDQITGKHTGNEDSIIVRGGTEPAGREAGYRLRTSPRLYPHERFDTSLGVQAAAGQRPQTHGNGSQP